MSKDKTLLGEFHFQHDAKSHCYDLVGGVSCYDFLCCYDVRLLFDVPPTVKDIYLRVWAKTGPQQQCLRLFGDGEWAVVRRGVYHTPVDGIQHRLGKLAGKRKRLYVSVHY